MKNKQKSPVSPDPRRAHPGRLRRHILRLTGFALLLSTLLILFSLLVVGLPPDLTNRITAQIQAAGIPLQVQSIHLSTHRGWVFKDVRLYSTSPDDLQPLLRAKKIYILFWPVDWKNPIHGGWHIKLYAKNMNVSLGRPWESVLPENHPFSIVNRLEASLTTSPGHLRVENAALDWGGIDMLAHGNAVFAEKEKKAPTRDFRRQAAKAADALSELKCAESPQLNLNFNLNTLQPDETFLDADLSAKGLIWRDCTYQHLAGTLAYRNSDWKLASLELSQSDNKKLALHGEFNLFSSNAQVSVENTLSAADLFNLLPEEAQSAVAQTGIKPYGSFNFTASAGPAPVNRLAETAELQLQKAQLMRDDITLDPVALHLTRNGSRIEINNISARANGGPLTGRVEFNLDTMAWTAHVQAQCPPIIAGAYDEDLRLFISRFEFPVTQPKADLTLSQSAPGESLVIDGTLSGEHFTCGGVPIDHLETSMVYSNKVVDLTPIHLNRAEAQFDGSVQVDFARHLGLFNVTNSFPPADIARALAPEEHTVLEQIRCDGPIYSAGRGQVDYHSWTNHAFNGIFRADKIGFGKLEAAHFDTDIEASGTQLIFTNATIQIYGGSAKGSADFDIFLQDGSGPYRINAKLSQMDLAQMLTQLSSGSYGRTRGQLSGAFELSADAKAEFWKSVQGGGRINIKDGHLADVPFLGGFSRLVQSAFSSFTLFSLTSFSADYTLHDSAIWSDNAQLGGALLSARGRGSYSPENGLDFVVAAEPFRPTDNEDKEWYQLNRWATDALKGGAAPFMRLFEFQLSGPLDKPEWRFVNLPKEVSDAIHRVK